VADGCSYCSLGSRDCVARIADAVRYSVRLAECETDVPKPYSVKSARSSYRRPDHRKLGAEVRE